MKTVTILLFFIAIEFLSPTTSANPYLFTKHEFTLMGGLNFEKSSNINEVFSFEGALNLSHLLYLKLFTGYYNTVSNESFNVSSFKYVKIEDYEKYHAISYDVLSTDYQVIPIGIGLLFYILEQNYSPYLHFSSSYNFIDPLTNQTSEIFLGAYNSKDEMPEEYRNRNVLPNNSIGFSLGFGSKFLLTTTFELNVRYLFNIDSAIINTHQVLVGVTF